MMNSAQLRILFAGNPSIAVPALVELAKHAAIVGVLTNPDRPVGRGRHLEPPPVKAAAEQLGLPVLQYDRLGRDARERASELQPNFLVSFACGHYFGPKFLSLFSQGAINIHPSLLPKYRGSAPLQFAIIHGEKITGISIQRIVETIDSGDVLAAEAIELEGTETTEQLEAIVAPKAASLIVRTITQLSSGSLVEQHQNEQDATYTRLLTKSDGTIDWSERVQDIHGKVRAFLPWPKASTSFHGKLLHITGVYGSIFSVPHEPLEENAVPGTVIKVVKKRGLAVACGDGILYVTRVQLAQKKEMDCFSFVNGNPEIVGSVLGSENEE